MQINGSTWLNIVYRKLSRKPKATAEFSLRGSFLELRLYDCTDLVLFKFRTSIRSFWTVRVICLEQDWKVLSSGKTSKSASKIAPVFDSCSSNLKRHNVVKSIIDCSTYSFDDFLRLAWIPFVSVYSNLSFRHQAEYILQRTPNTANILICFSSSGSMIARIRFYFSSGHR